MTTDYETLAAAFTAAQDLVQVPQYVSYLIIAAVAFTLLFAYGTYSAISQKAHSPGKSLVFLFTGLILAIAAAIAAMFVYYDARYDANELAGTKIVELIETDIIKNQTVTKMTLVSELPKNTDDPRSYLQAKALLEATPENPLIYEFTLNDGSLEEGGVVYDIPDSAWKIIDPSGEGKPEVTG